ncbi:MAG: hypothetical protein GWM91_16085, partial [Actinobacteria bacterium]|nr:hypothetical protein [Actinomycetota bacterium]NIX51829.1 hypothetical protein [Actinomycetota bacterium]
MGHDLLDLTAERGDAAAEASVATVVREPANADVLGCGADHLLRQHGDVGREGVEHRLGVGVGVPLHLVGGGQRGVDLGLGGGGAVPVLVELRDLAEREV